MFARAHNRTTPWPGDMMYYYVRLERFDSRQDEFELSALTKPPSRSAGTHSHSMRTHEVHVVSAAKAH